MRLPQMQGEEWPGGISADQTAFSDGLKVVGGCADSATPWPLGPRNCGQKGWALRTEKSPHNASNARDALRRPSDWSFTSTNSPAHQLLSMRLRNHNSRFADLNFALPC